MLFWIALECWEFSFFKLLGVFRMRKMINVSKTIKICGKFEKLNTAGEFCYEISENPSTILIDHKKRWVKVLHKNEIIFRYSLYTSISTNVWVINLHLPYSRNEKVQGETTNIARKRHCKLTDPRQL